MSEDSKLMGLLESLSVPLKYTKEKVSGDELEWFSPEGMNPHVYAAGNVLGDLLLDPINFVPVGPIAALGTKALKRAPALSKAGNFFASAPNYIKNMYGLTDDVIKQPTATSPLKNTTMFEDMATSAMSKNMPEDHALAAIRKGKGLLEWGKDSAINVAHALTPSGRALYSQTGINKGAQQTAKQHIDNFKRTGNPRDQAKASAQVNYNRHQNVQAGREGAVHPSMQKVSENSNLVDYQKNTKGTVSDMLYENTGTKTGARKNAVAKPDPIPRADANYMENHMKVWGDTDNVVMKRVQSGHGGNHFRDFTRKSPMASVVADAFGRHGWNPTPKQLYNSLKVIEAEQAAKIAKGLKPNGFKVKNPSFADVEKNGLWLTGSINGSAITEGGVNWLAKIDVDGTMAGIISDKHDFLDKGPEAAAKLMNKLFGTQLKGNITKESLLTVTPVMKVNVKKLKGAQYQKAVKNPKLQGTHSSIHTPKQDGTQLGMLEDFVNAKPTKDAVNAERMSDVLKATAAANIGSKTTATEDN